MWIEPAHLPLWMCRVVFTSAPWSAWAMIASPFNPSRRKLDSAEALVWRNIDYTLRGFSLYRIPICKVGVGITATWAIDSLLVGRFWSFCRRRSPLFLRYELVYWPDCIQVIGILDLWCELPRGVRRVRGNVAWSQLSDSKELCHTIRRRGNVHAASDLFVLVPDRCALC